MITHAAVTSAPIAGPTDPLATHTSPQSSRRRRAAGRRMSRGALAIVVAVLGLAGMVARPGIAIAGGGGGGGEGGGNYSAGNEGK